MRPRQRIPVIFSLSMLDVLCCGLGAVILLLVLYSWDARRQAKSLVLARARVGETAERLTLAEASLETTRLELEEQSRQRDEALARLAAVTRQAEEARKRLADSQQALDALQLRLDEAERARLEAAALAGQLPGLREELVHAQQLNLDLSVNLGRERLAAAELRERLRAADQQRMSAEASAEMVPGLRKELAIAAKKAKELEDALAASREEAEKAAIGLAAVKEQYAAAEQKVASLDREAVMLRRKSADAAAQLAETQKALHTEKTQSAALRRENSLDARFAGVDLSGRRVVLLIDTSGSMGSVDEKNADPNKWPEVCRTVGQVLNSLPHVEKYQVILFADEVRYLQGKPGQWLDFEKAKTPDEARDALLKVKPSGNTRMYPAFETAFQFRSQGLDTIYLFSDGLPNVGPGLPSPPPRDETVQANLLGKYVRDAIRTRWNASEPRVKVHAIGFFYESPNLGAFLWALSRENGGSFVGMSKP